MAGRDGDDLGGVAVERGADGGMAQLGKVGHQVVVAQEDALGQAVGRVQRY